MATEVSAKELRREAKRLEIEGYEDMSRKELQAAVNAAQGEAEPKSTKTKTKAASKTKAPKASSKSKAKAKTSSKKTSAKKVSSEGEGPNPFREGTNRWLVADQLLSGGKRAQMIKNLRKKFSYGGGVEDLDAVIDHEILDVSSILRKQYGMDVAQEGRGRDAHIRATPV